LGFRNMQEKLEYRLFSGILACTSGRTPQKTLLSERDNP
jgi:hypothetical protein